MQRVDGDHDVGDDDVVDQHGIGADRGDDGAGIGEPAGLEHDLGQSRIAGRDAAAFVADAAQFRDELVTAGAATAAAGQTLSRDARPSSASSTGVSAASLTMTAASENAPACSWWRSQVVLPDPRNPPSIVRRSRPSAEPFTEAPRRRR